MKHSLRNKTLCVLTVTSFTSLSALAAESGVALSVLGAASLQNPTVSDSGTNMKVDGSTSFGGGVGAEVVVGEALGLEVDALYLNHKFKSETASFFGRNVTSTVHSGYLHFPVLVRYHPIPYLNLGLGGYYSRVLGGWNVSAAGFGDLSADYGKNDFGFVAAAGTIIPITENLAIVGDVRYARSLTDSARESSDALKFSDFQGLVGVRIGIN